MTITCDCFFFTSVAVHIQDSSFLFMGRLLEGFGVGVISYTVCLPFSSLLVKTNYSSGIFMFIRLPTVKDYNPLVFFNRKFWFSQLKS
jgi:hypothetical protein